MCFNSYPIDELSQFEDLVKLDYADTSRQLEESHRLSQIKVAQCRHQLVRLQVRVHRAYQTLVKAFQLIKVVIWPIVHISVFDKPGVRKCCDDIKYEPGAQISAHYRSSFHHIVSFLVVPCHKVQD